MLHVTSARDRVLKQFVARVLNLCGLHYLCLMCYANMTLTTLGRLFLYDFPNFLMDVQWGTHIKRGLGHYSPCVRTSRVVTLLLRDPFPLWYMLIFPKRTSCFILGLNKHSACMHTCFWALLVYFSYWIHYCNAHDNAEIQSCCCLNQLDLLITLPAEKYLYF